MTLFWNIFGSNGKSAGRETDTLTTEVPRELFIDEEAPSSTPTPVLRRTPMEVLNDRPYESMGYRDGYDHHDPSQMDAAIAAITAEYRDALREEVRKLDEKIHEVAPHLNDEVRELMPTKYMRLRDRYDRLTLEKAELQGQLELALQGEGVCETALAKYRLGFRNGMSTYFDERFFTNH